MSEYVYNKVIDIDIYSIHIREDGGRFKVVRENKRSPQAEEASTLYNIDDFSINMMIEDLWDWILEDKLTKKKCFPYKALRYKLSKKREEGDTKNKFDPSQYTYFKPSMLDFLSELVDRKIPDMDCRTCYLFNDKEFDEWILKEREKEENMLTNNKKEY